MWLPSINPDGDSGWTSTFVYTPDLAWGYTEAELKSILAKVVACETIDGFGCGISDDDLTAAVEYTQFYINGSEILCTTYLKTNLLYDLQTNTEGITNFTEIHFHDWRGEEKPDFDGKYLFDKRYIIFQAITSESYPGLLVSPIIVDIMFQIVAINEGKIFLFEKMVLFNCNQVNLAGEYLDVVLALTMEWDDGRLKWPQYEWSDIPVRTLQVDSDDIWTPNIDLANRNHDHPPGYERHLETTIRNDGKISFNN